MGKKHYLGRCFPCWSGYQCNKKKTNLPRKKKKLVKRLLKAWETSGAQFTYDYPSLCDLRAYYRFVHLLGFFEKYGKAIKQIVEAGRDDDAVFIVDAMDGEYYLGFAWEGDNGLYTVGGVMKFNYTDEPQRKDEWSHRATIDTMAELGVYDKKSDIELIKFVHKYGNI